MIHAQQTDPCDNSHLNHRTPAHIHGAPRREQNAKQAATSQTRIQTDAEAPKHMPPRTKSTRTKQHTYYHNRGPTIAENRAAAACQVSQYRPDKVIADLTQLHQKAKPLRVHRWEHQRLAPTFNHGRGATTYRRLLSTARGLPCWLSARTFSTTFCTTLRESG